MASMSWMLIDEEGLIVMSGGEIQTPIADLDYLASVVYMGYLSLKKVMDEELQTPMEEIMIPSEKYLMILKPLESEYLLLGVFDRDTAMGLARLELKKLTRYAREQIQELKAEPAIPGLEGSEGTLQSRLQQLLELIQDRAPDPAFMLKRLALRTGIPEERIRSGNLSSDEMDRLETHLANMLGLGEAAR
jgi:predicted regulator of Ras-like GTPase activity (Roadblock/LC7/MglB family)